MSCHVMTLFMVLCSFSISTTSFVRKLNRSVTAPLEKCDKAGSTAYYWYHKTLNISSDIDERKGLNWKLSLSLLAAWVLVAGCMIKGIKSTGKVIQCSLHSLKYDFGGFCIP